MDQDQQNAAIEKTDAMVDPWHQSLKNPAAAQETVLQQLVKIYGQTEYGRSHAADRVDSYESYQKLFPVMTYEDYKPLLDRVMAGETSLLL